MICSSKLASKSNPCWLLLRKKPPPPAGTPGLLLAGKVKGQSLKEKVQLQEIRKTIEIKIYDL